MSWFEINTETLGYSNLMGAAGTSEQYSFSSISWYFYCFILIGFIFLGYRVLVQANRFGDKLASYCRVAVVLSAVFIIYGSYLVILLWNTPFLYVPERVRDGVFGDSFGTLNALFSGLAFSGVLITLLFQRKDLSETRAQIENQQIESQFYSMLEQQQEVVRNFDLQNKSTNEVIARGRDCFRDWSESLHAIQKHLSIHRSDTAHAVSYELLYQIGRADLSLYFRSLYSVFRFIESSSYKGDANFGLVVRSLLSDYELVILFYNSLSPRGTKFKRFIYKHALFDNLDPGLLLDPMHAVELDLEAFGQNEEILILFPDNKEAVN